MVHPYFRNKFDLAVKPLGQAPNPANPAPIEPEEAVVAPASSPPITSPPIERPDSSEEIKSDDGLDDCSDTYDEETFSLDLDDPPLSELRADPFWNIYTPHEGMKPRHKHSIFGPTTPDGGCTIRCTVNGKPQDVSVPAWVGGLLKFKSANYDRTAKLCDDQVEAEQDGYLLGAASHACAMIKEFKTELGGKFKGDWDTASEELGDFLTPCAIRGAGDWDCHDWDAQHYSDAVGDSIPYSEGREKRARAIWEAYWFDSPRPPLKDDEEEIPNRPPQLPHPSTE